jgi:hypothetical protein
MPRKKREKIENKLRKKAKEIINVELAGVEKMVKVWSTFAAFDTDTLPRVHQPRSRAPIDFLGPTLDDPSEGTVCNEREAGGREGERGREGEGYREERGLLIFFR